MADEQQGDEIGEILSDLDNILSDISSPSEPGVAPPPPKPAAPAPAPTPAPAPAPKPSPPPPAAAAQPKIELAPRAGLAPVDKKPAAQAQPAPKPGLASRPPLEISIEAPGGPSNPTAAAAQAPAPASAPKVEAPKPSAPPPALKPATAPAPVPPPASKPAPASAPPAAAGGADDVPEKTPKEQIRRVAYLYAAEHAEKKDALAKFMAQSAQTISKKPLFLRRVLVEETAPSADGKAILARAQAVKAVAVLGILEGLPESKIRELTEVFSGAGILFRVVGPEEVQKRSLAVDLIVDMMLLSPES